MNSIYVLPQIAVSLLAIAGVYRFILRPQRAETARSQLRNIRDALFDYMVDKRLSHSDPAYVETRQVINGMIRLTSSASIGPIQCIILSLRMRDDDNPQCSLFDEIENSSTISGRKTKSSLMLLMISDAQH